MPISRDGVTKILVTIFLRSGLTSITPLELGEKIKDINDFNKILLNKKSKKNVTLYQIHGLIMQLIASNIIELFIKDIEGNKLTYCALAFESNSYPAYTNDDHWKKLVLIE